MKLAQEVRREKNDVFILIGGPQVPNTLDKNFFRSTPMWIRKLPRQVDHSKVEDLALFNASAGVIPPRLSRIFRHYIENC